MADLRRLTAEDLPHWRRAWREKRGDEFMMVHKTVYESDGLDGFILEEGSEWIGEHGIPIRDEIELERIL